ncbi:germin-like protein subfamily 1 member 1 [Juglans microcarpa x Juglans regia]|uniref:germin-like protein subfamily 1 member 1 n=1 Tax=Juglans microcarpa x Juglans regia TaxID=2249226 RepID=UPI001B7F27B4|nr:germin-like protein subfamily 1 member 1 [Juglans microcarpa x Juglans regia]
MQMKTKCSILLQLFLGLALLLGLAKPDPDPLQDYCIADNKSPQYFFTNGAPCINPDKAESSHFATSVLSKPGNTGSNKFGFNVTLTNTVNLPGLNTQGLTLARIDVAVDGIVVPHSHPRASEVTICLEGLLHVGFVDTSNRLYTRTLRAGDAFVFPKGLIHYLYNGSPTTRAVAVSGLNSQNPGAQLTSFATFTSIPEIPDEVLKKAFQISKPDVTKIRRNLGG